MGSRARLFLVLWLAGFAGVLSFLLVDLDLLISMLPLPEGAQQPAMPPVLLKLLSVFQPTILITLAVVAGTWLAPKVGLHAPAAEAFAEKRPIIPALLPQIIPGVIAGILSGVAIVSCWLLAKPYLTAEFIDRAQGFNDLLPPITRFLYGGFTEEILLRWGIMTLLVWAFWKILGRREESPRSVWFVIAIFGSALLFGAGHLPIAALLAGGLTVPLVVYVIAANSLFGIVAGFLYWKRGLESAIIAHMCAHVVLLAAIALS